MEQPPATTPQTPAAAEQDNSIPPGAGPPADSPGFAARGRLRRRARFLRKARELAYRDLGGLVFDLHRFGARNDQLVLAKLETLSHLDGELRALEQALGDQHQVTVLREAGVTACPRCAAIHGSEDRFCPNCGLAVSRHVDLPIAGPATSPAPATPPVSAASSPAPAPPSVSTPAPAPALPAPPTGAPPGAPPVTEVHPVQPAGAPQGAPPPPAPEKPTPRAAGISPSPRPGP